MKWLIILTTLFLTLNSLRANDLDGYRLEVIQNNDEYSLIKITILNYFIESIDSSLDKIEIPNCTQNIRKGYPELPKIVTSFSVNPDREMTINVLSSVTEEINNVHVCPSKGTIYRNIDPERIPFEYADIYNINENYPKSITELGDSYMLRDIKGHALTIFPFQYNPVEDVLLLHKEIIIEVNYTLSKKMDATKNSKNLSREFSEIYINKFVNYSKSRKRYLPLEEEGDMLVICHDDFYDKMLPFVEWKIQKGISTKMIKLSDIGSTSLDIKNYVQSCYDTDAITYLLLVGDHQQVPVSNTEFGESDHAYGFVAGDDHYADIIVGRFSAEDTTQVASFVKRTLQYEKDSGTGDCYGKGVGIASDEGTVETDWEHMRRIKDTLMTHTYTVVDEFYEGSQGGADLVGNPTSSQVENSINEGRGVVNYTGHGEWNGLVTSDFNITSVNSLTNVGKLPFGWFVACDIGIFTSKTCFAEVCTRAEYNDEPTGFVACVGATILQAWVPPMIAQQEMNNILADSYSNNIKRTYGGITINGIYKMLDTEGASGEETGDTWVIFGDPSLNVRTDITGTIVASNEDTVTIGTSSIQVSCDVEGALVALSTHTKVVGTAYASGGLAVINFADGLSVGDTVLFVTATAYNYAPYQDTVIVNGVLSPEPNFESDAQVVTEGDTIRFSDASLNSPNSWVWLFEGGEPSISGLKSPVVKYAQVGVFEVKLIVENVFGKDSLTVAGYITVNAASEVPDVDFLSDKQVIYTGDSVTFLDISTNNPNSWEWTFDNGNPLSSNVQNPVVIWNSTGVYSVTLDATNTVGLGSLTKVDHITVKQGYEQATSVQCDEYIETVVFGDIDNSSYCGRYENFLDISTQIERNKAYLLSVSIGNLDTGDTLACWIDWNRDGDFEDSNESYPLALSGGSYVEEAINVPADAELGETRFRLRITYQEDPLPYGVSDWGDVEDYTLFIINNTGRTDIESHVLIHPNPSNGIVNINVEGECFLQIYDIAGKELHSCIYDNNIVDLSFLTSGVYLTKVNGVNHKLIIQK